MEASFASGAKQDNLMDEDGDGSAGEEPEDISPARIEAGQSAWWYLVVLALLLLLVESTLSNRLSPRASWGGDEPEKSPRLPR